VEIQDSFAIEYIEKLLASDVSREDKAYTCLTTGQMMEHKGNYRVALECYARAFSLDPVQNDVWYFLHNNLAYCLNLFGRFEEAELYCRQAITINGERHNAHKNLAIALEGQAKYAESARALIVAVRICPRDPRALQHLEKLFGAHPEVESDIPDIFSQIEECQRAVQIARGTRPE